jgi:hypothetical protein
MKRGAQLRNVQSHNRMHTQLVSGKVQSTIAYVSEAIGQTNTKKPCSYDCTPNCFWTLRNPSHGKLDGAPRGRPPRIGLPTSLHPRPPRNQTTIHGIVHKHLKRSQSLRTKNVLLKYAVASVFLIPVTTGLIDVWC